MFVTCSFILITCFYSADQNWKAQLFVMSYFRRWAKFSYGSICLHKTKAPKKSHVYPTNLSISLSLDFSLLLLRFSFSLLLVSHVLTPVLPNHLLSLSFALCQSIQASNSFCTLSVFQASSSVCPFSLLTLNLYLSITAPPSLYLSLKCQCHKPNSSGSLQPSGQRHHKQRWTY